jgi:hypothetical protein
MLCYVKNRTVAGSVSYGFNCRRTLVLAQELGDRAVEAQSCYSLGNTYTLLRDYPIAVEYHLRHLIIAQQLMDRVGEGMLGILDTVKVPIKTIM